jgi:hypothetical protein
MSLPLFSLEYGGCELYPFAAILNAGSEEQSPKMLFHGPGADVQLLRDFLVAASFDQQMQHLLIALRNLDVTQIQHCALLLNRNLQLLASIDSNSVHFL